GRPGPAIRRGGRGRHLCGDAVPDAGGRDQRDGLDRGASPVPAGHVRRRCRCADTGGGRTRRRPRSISVRSSIMNLRSSSRDERGQITVLMIGFAVVLVMFVGVVVNASHVFLERRSLSSWADGAVTTATQQV